MKNNRILVITSREEEREQVAKALKARSFFVEAASSPEEIRSLFRDFDFSCAIIDWEMPGMSGVGLVEEINRNLPGCGIIAVTARGSVEVAVEALKAGAYDCLAWPLDERRLVISVVNLLEKEKIARESIELRQHLKDKYKFGNIIGTGSRMQEVYRVISHLLPSKTTVLIRGESGTGKEIVAEAIHYNGPRAHLPLIKVHCAALTETLLESELFGHEKGAFTGAVKQKIGRFELADGGTLFLDEIGEISSAVQVKLLRVLEEERFERVGGTKSIKVDIRIIAATSTDLEAGVEKGTFREDLYYRLNVVPVLLPALRERREDIPALTEHFLQKFNQISGRKIEGVTPGVLSLFMSYYWPGNVRELEHAIEHAVVLCADKEISRVHLPLQLRTARHESGEAAGGKSLADMERKFIIETLEEHDWNRSVTARILGIDRSTLYQKIKKYQLQPER